MRVLSIDWDYFMKCSGEDRVLKFPDGGNENIGIAFSNMIWMSRYAECDDIQKIGVKKKELDSLMKIIEKNRENFYFGVFESHKHLGEFLLNDEMADKIKETGLEIVNIDYHHDAYNIGENLNCGNWLNRVLDKYPDAKVTWVKDEYSENLGDSRIVETTQIYEADRRYDFIYLCRSGVWSCPHLDKEFGVLLRYIFKRSLVNILRQETPNRWDDDMKRGIKAHREVINQSREALPDQTKGTD